jgi:hypothetical protein
MTVHTTNSEQFSSRKKAGKKQKNYQAVKWYQFEKLTETIQQATEPQAPRRVGTM